MDTLIFLLSKLAGAMLRAESWLLLILALGLLAQMRGGLRAARRLLGLGLGMLLCLSLVPVGQWLIAPLETRYPPMPQVAAPDGIIVLGGGEEADMLAVWGLPHVNGAGDRFIAGAALARQFPEAQLIFTGGGGSVQVLLGGAATEASTAAEIFGSLGIAPDRMVLEDRARNTTENARNSHAIVQPQGDQSWILVTSAFHMPRAMRSFERAGWTGITPWPVDYRSGRGIPLTGWNLSRNLEVLNIAIREHVGLLAYRLLGR